MQLAKRLGNLTQVDLEQRRTGRHAEAVEDVGQLDTGAEQTIVLLYEFGGATSDEFLVSWKHQFLCE